MFVAQTSPYLRTPGTFTSAEHFGETVAHHDLVEAALSSSWCDGVHYFLRPHLHTPSAASGIASLNSRFADKSVQLFNVEHFVAESTQRQYAVPVGLESTVPLITARKLAKADLFPVSTLVHSIPNHGYSGLYTALLLFSADYDYLVLTSKAGEAAVRNILSGYSDYIKHQTNGCSLGDLNICNIPLGVDVDTIRPIDKVRARADRALPRDSIVILYVGRFTDRSKADLDPLLVAFWHLLKQIPTAVLVLAGRAMDPIYVAHLHSLAESLDLTDSLQIVTDFPFKDKPLLYGAADIFVSPADNVQETFGIAVIEAMAAGLPCVVSDWSGYRELIEDGTSGFLIPTVWSSTAAEVVSSRAALDERTPKYFLAQNTIVDVHTLYQRLLLLCQEKELRFTMGLRSREIAVSTFSWPHVVNQYEQLWTEQWARLRSAQHLRSTDLNLSFDSVFSHFATSSEQPSHLSRVDSLPDRFIEMLLDGDSQGSNLSTIDRRQFFASRGEAGPVQTQSPKAQDCFASNWCLKKGLLAFSNNK